MKTHNIVLRNLKETISNHPKVKEAGAVISWNGLVSLLSINGLNEVDRHVYVRFLKFRDGFSLKEILSDLNYEWIGGSVRKSNCGVESHANVFVLGGVYYETTYLTNNSGIFNSADLKNSIRYSTRHLREE